MRIKVLLEKGETQRDADLALYKAVTFHSNGDAHEAEFMDAAIKDIYAKLEQEYNIMITNTIREISDQLEDEYNDGGLL